MIFGFNFWNVKPASDLRSRKFFMPSEDLQNFNRRFVESTCLWLRALKLLLKVCYLFLEVRRLRFRYLKLTSENRNLVSKYSDLLLLKINYIFFDSGISERIYDVARDLLPVHTETVNQEADASYNPIIRQVCNTIVYVDSWQTLTLTKRLSIKSRMLPNPNPLKVPIFLSRQNSSASYAKPKSVSSPAKPLCQKTIEKTGEVRFPLLSAFNVGFREGDCIGSFPLWLSTSAFSFSAPLFHLKKYVVFLLTIFESIRIYSDSQDTFMANKRQSKEKRALILAALCEGTPMRAVARMFKTDKKRIGRVIRETGEAFADYMDKNFRDLPCLRIEMDEQWQYVGAHGSRLIKPENERGDFWLWCCIDADTKLVISHRVGKRDWWTGNSFVEDVRNRVRLPVQIATDNHRPYAFHIRQHFGYEGYSYGTETKIFGEPKLSDGTLARLGRNEGVRKMETAERKAVVGSPDLEGLTTSHVERIFLTVRQELKRFERKGLGYSKNLDMHKLAVALHFGVYNLVRQHKTLGTTPAVAAGVEFERWSLERVVEMTADYMRRKED